MKASPLPRPAAPPSAVRLLLSQRVPLIKLDTVIAARGEFADAIRKHVNKGRLCWVFNVAAKPVGSRELRFWNREVSAFAAAQRNDLAAIRATDPQSVVNEILGDRQQFGPGDVCLLLGIRRQTLQKLRPQLGGGRETFPRRGLEQFLKRRLVQ